MREKTNNYLIKFLAVLGFLVLIIMINFGVKIKEYKKDYLMTVVAEDGIRLVNISTERKVINTLKIDEKVNMWYPDGTGWNSQDRVKILLNKKNEFTKLMFYNFGFLPDKNVYLNNSDEWKKMTNLIGELGWGRFVYFSMIRENMIFNNELITTKLDDNFDKLSEIMLRDFVSSETMLSENNVKISVVNTTQESGLASFLTSRLEWMGGLVVTVSNESRQMSEACELEKNEKKKIEFFEETAKEVLGCKVKINNSLADDQIELYFGESFAKMIKYSSYVRTF